LFAFYRLRHSRANTLEYRPRAGSGAPALRRSGASIEGGQVWNDRSDISSGDFINAGSIYLAMDSPIGPVYLAYGRSEDSLDALYLALGWPFLSNQLRLGR